MDDETPGAAGLVEIHRFPSLKLAPPTMRGPQAAFRAGRSFGRKHGSFGLARSPVSPSIHELTLTQGTSARRRSFPLTVEWGAFKRSVRDEAPMDGRNCDGRDRRGHS